MYSTVLAKLRMNNGQISRRTSFPKIHCASAKNEGKIEAYY